MNYYLLGVVVGIVFALAVFFISAYLHRKKHPETGKYDERQIIGRGKAFQAGFFTVQDIQHVHAEAVGFDPV